MEPGVTPLNIKDPYPLALPRTKDEKHKIPQFGQKNGRVRPVDKIENAGPIGRSPA